jgi:hypothetical protein
MFSKICKICYGCYIGNNEFTKSAYDYSYMNSVTKQ